LNYSILSDEVHRVLNLTGAAQHLSFNDNHCADHIVHSIYVEQQNFMGLSSHESRWGSQIPIEFFKDLLCVLGPLQFILVLEKLEQREPSDAEFGNESA
jgi:hypothetical protein